MVPNRQGMFKYTIDLVLPSLVNFNPTLAARHSVEIYSHAFFAKIS